MRKIWKQDINGEAAENELVPTKVKGKGWIKILTVAMQQSVCRVWFEVDDDGEPSEVLVYCVGTFDYTVPAGCRYVGTVTQGSYAWHFYTPDLGYVSESRIHRVNKGISISFKIPTDQEIEEILKNKARALNETLESQC